MAGWEDGDWGKVLWDGMDGMGWDGGMGRWEDLVCWMMRWWDGWEKSIETGWDGSGEIEWRD